MKHTHHIIPRHMGGSDDPSNLVELTVEEHADAHRILYEQHGCWQDKVAWQGLLGLIGHDDIMREMWDARKGKGNVFYGKKHTKESLELMSKNRQGKGTGPKSEETRKRMSENHHRCRAGKDPWNKGKTLGPQSAEIRRKKGKPLIYNGVEYNSLNEAEKLSGVSSYKISKTCLFI